VIVAGIWRPLPARAPQSRWHALTTCCVGEAADYRARAAGWLSQRLSDFGTRQAQYALAALSGNAAQLGPLERHAALRFMLGLPDSPRAQIVVESKEAARTLALAYGRGFLKWIVGILNEGRKAACVARSGPRVKPNAVHTTVISYRDRIVVLDRPAPRSVWTTSRGLREVWSGACLVRRAFRALRLWTIMAGPEVLDKMLRPRGVPAAEPDRQGGHEAGCLAYDQWSDFIHLTMALAEKLHTIADKLLAIAGKHRRKLVWLRNAGFDPTIERRKQALKDAREQAARDARLRRQAAKAARAAAHNARQAQVRAARDAAAERAEDARRASAAVTRPQRASVASTTAAIDVARVCNQSTPFEPAPAVDCDPETPEHPRLRCTRGHFLVPAPVRSGRGSFQTRCNGPCGLQIRPGTMRWMCEGQGCDLDICLECVDSDDSEGPSRARTRCPRGHSMCFRITSALAHPDRKCDGKCRKPLVEGTWAYACTTCSLDLCAACAPSGFHPALAPPVARASRKRARAPPPQREKRRRIARGVEAPRRARSGGQRRNLFVDATDDGSTSGDDAPQDAQGRARGRGDKRPREQDATGPHPGEPLRQNYGEGPGRKRSGPTSIHSRGQGP
jgi:hypothetical protein